MKIKAEYVIYGIEKGREMINNIIDDLKGLCLKTQDIKLILSEAISNAYLHGNNRDCSKPIYIRYECKNKIIKFEVIDCGKGIKNITIPDEITDEGILSETGRGLFLIKCFADEVKLNENSLVIYKSIE